VSGTSSSDVWAVGNASPPPIYHWDGGLWTQVEAPTPPSVLYGVTAVSLTDAWAVGSGGTGEIAEHWDGTGWTMVPVPSPGGSGYLYDVAASHSADVWAVGNYAGEGGIHPQALHWNGAVWSNVPAPDGSPFGTNSFQGVTATSPTDAWAVGYQDITGGGIFQPLIEHWDGAVWKVVPAAPPPSGHDNQLFSVSASSSTDVWAVGGYANPAKVEPLIEHWDGIAWSVVRGVGEPGAANNLLGVSALAPNDVWAVGKSFPLHGRYDPLTEHWDGSRWTRIKARSPGDDADLEAVDAISSTDIWAVGVTTGTQSFSLVEHSNGACEPSG
jgi:hypothetical protein